jgi:hypothetical protein
VVLTIYSNVLLGKKTLPTGDHPSPGGQRLTAGAPSGCGSHPLSLAATLTLAPTDSLAGMSRRDCPPPSDPPGGPTLAQSRGHPFCPLIQYWPFMPHGGFTGSDDEEDLNWLPLCSSPKGKGVARSLSPQRRSGGLMVDAWRSLLRVPHTSLVDLQPVIVII